MLEHSTTKQRLNNPQTTFQKGIYEIFNYEQPIPKQLRHSYVSYYLCVEKTSL